MKMNRPYRDEYTDDDGSITARNLLIYLNQLEMYCDWIEQKNYRKVIDNDTGRVFESVSEAARELHCSRNEIAYVCNLKKDKSKHCVNVDWYYGERKND